MALAEQDFPVCFKCGHRVEKVTTANDDLRMCLIVTAHCHGETETVVLSDEDRCNLRGDIFINGYAFKPRLP
jgi:hypothetical protein